MKKLLLLLSLFVSISLLATEPETPYLTSESDSLALVEGVINAYNGKLVLMDQDIRIQGQDGLEMSRYYDGGHHHTSEFGYGIGCSYPALFKYTQDDYKSYAFVELRQGNEVLFEVKKDKNRRNVFTGHVSKKYFKTGYTNCCEALLRGEPSIYAMNVECYESNSIVTLGNGTKRHYKAYVHNPNKGSYYLLWLEEMSNGNRRHFYYHLNNGYKLKRIDTTNCDESLVLNWLNFEYDKLHVAVQGSNGQHAHYIKHPQNGTVKSGNTLHGYTAKPIENVLREASHNHYPAVNYEVLKNTTMLNTIFSVTKVKKSNGELLSVEFDSKERVKKLFVSGEKTALYTFKYDMGFTTTIDARGAKKTFQFNKRRLTKLIEEHRTQEFKWDEKGQLTDHIIRKPSHDLLSKQNYFYDDRGNVLEIKLQGCLTQKNCQDTSVTTYTYLQENNVVLSQKQNQNIEYQYSYIPGRTLLSSKFTIASGKIEQREFYTYDKNAILICKIVDDGRSTNQDDLTDVTYRLITEIEPQLNPDIDGMTLPKTIKEYYQDLKSTNKILLKKREQLYTQGELLAEEKVFDGTDNYLYSLIYQYNHRRELILLKDALNVSTAYSYDDQGNKIYEEKLGSGKRVEFAYDLANRLIQEVERHENGKTLVTSHSYDLMGNRASTTDYFGNTTGFQYDKAGREVSVTNCHGHTHFKDYDPQGNVIKETDKDGYVTQSLFNLYKKPVEIIYPDGSTERFAYNLQGHLVQKWEKDGSFEIYEVDYKGRPIHTKTYGIDGSFLKETKTVFKGKNLISDTCAMGNVTTYSYDHAGRQIAKIEGDQSTFYEYDQLGRLSKTKTSDCMEIKLFDFLDRVIEERIEDFNGLVYKKKQNGYDINGNLISVKKYANADHYSETKTVYNSENQPILFIDALDNATTINYFYSDHLEKEIIDPLQRKEIQLFDRLGQLVAVHKQSATKELLALSSFAYDGRGNKIFQNDKNLFQNQDCGTHEIRTTFDGLGQKTSLTEQNEKTTSYTYKNSKLHEIIKPDGVILSHHYDLFGRLKELVSADGTIHYRYTYDLNDNLIKVEDLVQNSTTERSYDSLNRMVKEKQASGHEIYFTYDTCDRIKEVKYQAEKINYTYSPTTVISASRYKHDNQLYTFTQKTDWKGNVVDQTLPSNLKLTYVFDDLDRCLNIASTPFQQSFIYDKVGNLTSTSVKDPIGDYRSGFSYDDLNQITEESGAFINKYSFDSLNNRRNINGTICQVNELNQLTSESQANYTYDKNGNRTLKENIRYSYDALDRLICVSMPADTIKFKYDSFGRRIERASSNETIQYLYQFETEIGAIIDGNLSEFRAIYEQFAPFAIELKDKVYSPIRNHRGDISVLLDPQSNVASTYRFDAFGQFICEGKVKSPWTFSGQRYDDTTELYRFVNRDYDSFTGRWLTPDPLGFADGPNLYAYVHNNPWIYVDPYGLLASEVGQNTNQPNASWTSRVSLNTRLHGALQAATGFTEMCGGGFIIGGSSGFATPLDAAMIFHGSDNIATGLRTAFTGSYHNTATSQILQKTGMSEQNANFVDNTVTTVSTMGGLKAINSANQANAISQLKLPPPGNSIPGMSSNRAIFERYQTGLRANMEKPYVVDATLKKFVNEIYRPNALIGNGSTGAAIRHEILTGGKVGGKLHSIKGREQIMNFGRWLKNNPNATHGDRAAAENIIKDISNALGE